MRLRRLHHGLLLLLLILPGAAADAQSQQETIVDLELALLVDVSASVSDAEFGLQAQGLATAFASPAVRAALEDSTARGLAVSVIQWSDNANQRLAVDWHEIRNDAGALEFAALVAAMPRLIHQGHTALGDALVFGLDQLERNRFSGLRRVIDLSGDGRANDGYPLRLARREAMDKGVTINGLAILNELPLLDRYFQKYLIGGTGAFVIVARDYGDFSQSMTEKLVREIRAIPLSSDDPRHHQRVFLKQKDEE